MSWKGFKKAVVRLPHNVKTKTGLSREAVDDDFELQDSRLRGIEEDFDQFMGQANQYKSCINAIFTHQQQISSLLAELFEPLGDDDSAVARPGLADAIESYIRISGNVQYEANDLVTQLDLKIISPITEVVSTLRSVRKLVAKRGHKLVDLTRYSEVVTKLNDKPNRDVSDEKKLYKYDALLQQAESEYNQINGLLLLDLPTLFQLKDQLVMPLFYQFLYIQASIQHLYYNHMSEVVKISAFEFGYSPADGFEASRIKFEHLLTKIDWVSVSVNKNVQSSFLQRLNAKKSNEDNDLDLPPYQQSGSTLNVPSQPFGHQRSHSNPNPSFIQPTSPSSRIPNLRSSPVSPILNKRPPPPAPTLPKARALYDYEAQAQGDLTLKEGDVIDVIKKQDDWWTGRLHGKVGIFPGNYVELI